MSSLLGEDEGKETQEPYIRRPISGFQFCRPIPSSCSLFNFSPNITARLTADVASEVLIDADLNRNELINVLTLLRTYIKALCALDYVSHLIRKSIHDQPLWCLGFHELIVCSVLAVIKRHIGKEVEIAPEWDKDRRAGNAHHSGYWSRIRGFR